MRKCGYCGSELDLDGEVVHLEGCTAPFPQGDEDAPHDADDNNESLDEREPS